MSTTTLIQVPEGGAKLVTGQPVPDNPSVPFIEGDGIGVDITPVMKDVVDAAVAKAYGGAREIHWMEVFAGEKSTRVYGADEWLPQETLETVREYSIAIKGPMTTPVGGGIRSLNVALRQELDLFVCLRPVRYFRGVPSPLKDPTGTDMVIFRENTEDIYAGIEWEAESDAVRKVIAFLQDEMSVRKIRFPETSGLGIKPVSRERPSLRHARAQGKHHEVHGGRIPRLGLRPRRARVRRRAVGRRTLDADAGRARDQGHDRGRVPAADSAPPARVRRDRDDEPQRRLHLRRARRAGRRHRHRTRREHVGRRRVLRGDARHGAEVRGPGQGQPRLADPVGGDDAAPPGVDGGRRSDRLVAGGRDRRQAGDVRPRTTDGRSERDLDVGLRPSDDRTYVSSG